MPKLLEGHSSLPVRHARQGDAILHGQMLVAPPDAHLSIALDGERLYAQRRPASHQGARRPQRQERC